MCLTMGILCAAAVVVGRLDHRPTKLQTYGLDLCGGEPCFRGIKVGTDWTTIKKLFPEAVMLEENNLLILDKDRNLFVNFSRSSNGSFAEYIVITAVDLTTNLPFNAGDLIAQYGDPCHVALTSQGGILWSEIKVYYAKMQVDYDTRTQVTGNYSLGNLNVIGIILADQGGICHKNHNSEVSPWHGFVSAEEYHDRFQYDPVDIP